VTHAHDRGVRLSSRQIRELHRVGGILASPLAFESIDAWRCSITAQTKPLIGADLVSFLLPTATTPVLSHEQWTAAAGDYPRLKAELDVRYGLRERELQLRVWNRDLLWKGWLDELYASPYYNEFIRPLKCFDALAMTVNVPGSVLNATLYCHHESERGRRFGAHGLGLLDVLYPAFAAGTRTVAHFGARRDLLGTIIDSLDVPCALYSSTGRCVHATPRLRALLATGVGTRLAAAMADAVRTLAAEWRHDEDDLRLGSTGRTMRTVRVDDVTVRLEITNVGTVLFGSAATYLIRVDAGHPALPTAAHLRARYGLTAREADIALLIAQGLTAPTIAERCQLSPHTVRRHTERIFARLGVHTRAAVAALVIGA
jgi:DNA-binding CsgD family transcriptional regulator